MEQIKDLTTELVKAEAKDRFYKIEGIIERLLAPQFFKRPFIYKKKGWGTIERIETNQDGTPQDLRAPKRTRKIRKGEEEIKIGDCWTFKTEKDGKMKKEHIIIPFGDNFGILKNSLRRSLEAQKRLRYDSLPLALMKIYPLWLNVGEIPCESMKTDKLPEIILETRHTQRGDVMVESFFDYIENRPFNCIIEIDNECPINEEKFIALIKTLNTLDNIGASKRGKIKVTAIKQVQPNEEELEKMQEGIPIAPIIY